MTPRTITTEQGIILTEQEDDERAIRAEYQSEILGKVDATISCVAGGWKIDFILPGQEYSRFKIEILSAHKERSHKDPREAAEEMHRVILEAEEHRQMFNKDQRQRSEELKAQKDELFRQNQ